MGVELDEQNRRVDAVGARAENTHDEIRSARSRSMGTPRPQNCLAAPDGMCVAFIDDASSLTRQPW